MKTSVRVFIKNKLQFFIITKACKRSLKAEFRSGWDPLTELLMNYPNNLSLEQQFKLKIKENQITELRKNESKEYLYLLLRYMFIKDNIIKFMIKNSKF